MEVGDGVTYVLTALVFLLIGVILGNTISDISAERKAKREELRDKGILVGMTAPEAYLEGFSDGYHKKPNRHALFLTVNFGDRYNDGLEAGRAKRVAESETSARPR